MNVLRRLIGPLILLSALGYGIARILSQNDEAREVVGNAAWNLFTFFTTPFVFETSLALIGLITVITLSQWRIQKEGDGWVDMPDESEPAKPKND